MGQIKVTAAAANVDGTYTQISPLTDINALGNDEITITGTNFANALTTATTVTLGVKAGQSGTTADASVACTPTSTTPTQIKCKTTVFNEKNVGKIYEPTITVGGRTLTNPNSKTLTLKSSVD